MTASHWAKKKKAGTELRERDSNDFYPTPLTHVRLGLSPYAALRPKFILDIGAGEGVWGEGARELFPDSQLYGVDIRHNIPRHNAYNRLILGDFLRLEGNRPAFDLIVANPPYSLSEAIIRKAFRLLMDGAPMVMLFRLQFLASVKRNYFWAEEFPPTEIWVCSDRPSFSGNGRTDSDDYMLVHWRKGYRGKTIIDWKIADDTKRAKAAPKQQSLF